MTLNRSLAIVLVGALSACSMETLVEKGVEATYPDAERYSFQDAAGENILRYACEKGATEAATKKRAKAAHVYYDKSLQSFSEQLAVETLEKIGSGVGVLKVALSNNKKSDAWAETTQAKLQADYRCLNYGYAEIE